MELGNSDKNNLFFHKQKTTNKYHTNNLEIDINDTNHTIPIIAKNIKNNSRVLDLGCAQGKLGIYLHNFKSCIVDGVELNIEAVNEAKNSNAFNEIYNFSIEDTTSLKYKRFFSNKDLYDYIVLSDVFEHLYNPMEVLFQFTKKLKKNGSFFVSIPNVAHYDIINGLLNGEFNYGEKGLLDSTHIRFFTRSSFEELLMNFSGEYNINLSFELIGKTVFGMNEHCDFKKTIEVLSNNPELYSFQYVYKIDVQKNKNKLINYFKKVDSNKLIEKK